MNWRFKLSIRLALLRSMTAAAALLAGCTADSRTATSPDTALPITSPEYLANVATLVLTPTSMSVVKGASAQLTVVLRDAQGNLLPYASAWTSSATSVATVSATGLVTGVNEGTATITAKARSRSATSLITVTAAAAPTVASIVITPASSSVAVGASTQLSAVARNPEGTVLTGTVITWATSAAALVTISSAGLASGVSAGTATITASAAGISASAQVTATVVAPVPTVTISAASAPAGGTAATLTLKTGSPSGGVVTFASSGGTSVVTIGPVLSIGGGDYAALVTPVTAGTAITITPTLNGQPVTGPMPTFTVTAGTTQPPPPTGGTFQTPNILNGASFEGGFDGFTNQSLLAPRGVTIDATRSFLGSRAIRRMLPVTTGLGDNGGDFSYYMARISTPTAPAASYDRVWARWYMYLDQPIDGILKYGLWFSDGSNDQFGGLAFQGGTLRWSFIQEWGGPNVALATLTSLAGGWHSIEVDHWRNGDTSNGGNDYPSVAIWIDGVQITRQIGTMPTGSAWINGRLNAGRRGLATTKKLGILEVVGLLNGSASGSNANANTIAANLWIDAVSISSVGRIGP